MNYPCGRRTIQLDTWLPMVWFGTTFRVNRPNDFQTVFVLSGISDIRHSNAIFDKIRLIFTKLDVASIEQINGSKLTVKRLTIDLPSKLVKDSQNLSVAVKTSCSQDCSQSIYFYKGESSIYAAAMLTHISLFLFFFFHVTFTSTNVSGNFLDNSKKKNEKCSQCS